MGPGLASAEIILKNGSLEPEIPVNETKPYDGKGLDSSTALKEETRNLITTYSEDIPVTKSTKNDSSPLDVRWTSLELDKTEDSGSLESVDPDMLCGFGEMLAAPQFCQSLANKRVFLLLFCVSCILQGMFFTYFVSVLTTIEKLFQIRSQTTGIIMSATEIGQIGGSLLLSYYGGTGHRPRWMACGIFIFSICSFICAIPHFVFGATLLQDLSHLPSEEKVDNPFNVCLHEDSLLSSNSSSDSCAEENSSSFYLLSILFVALFGVGIGQTTLHILGIPYIDDNVDSKESPSYFSTTIGFRIFGPTLGFVLGSFCTRLYVFPFEDVNFGPTDSRWVGAWWLGLLLISFVLAISSILMALFPKRLPPSSNKWKSSKSHEKIVQIPQENLTNSKGSNTLLLTEEKNYKNTGNHLKSDALDGSSMYEVNPFLDKFSEGYENGKPYLETVNDSEDCFDKKPERNFADFLKALRRLLSNKILISRTASSVLHLLPIMGLYTFLPKYLETQFRLPVHSAAMITGTGGILVMAFGIFASGFVIRKLNPSPRVIAFWIACTALLYSIGMFILMTIGGCSHDDIEGYSEQSRYMPICERNCSGCDENFYSPICSSDGRTFFSACHVGCSSVSLTNTTNQFQISSCECLEEEIDVRMGLCNSSCPNILWYMIIFCIFVVIHSTSEVGGMMLTLRCVEPLDKSLALGLISVAIGIFGNVPCPILYGAVVDSACLHWRTSCNGQGACQVYNSTTFRYFFHGTTGVVMFFAFVADLFVWKYSDTIVFDDSSDEGSKSNDVTVPDQTDSSSKTGSTSTDLAGNDAHIGLPDLSPLVQPQGTIEAQAKSNGVDAHIL